MTRPDPVPALSRGARGIATAFLVSGVIHLVRPQVFEPVVPRALPDARRLVLWSGVAELVCAAGLLVPRTRRVAGPASAALLVAVLPGNVQMAGEAVGALRARRTPATVTRAAVMLARVPLQWPMIRWVARAGREQRVSR
ncbi:MAG TPA: DoxX family protein [Cellulomonas sp.]